jgi:hypothetical protein
MQAFMSPADLEKLAEAQQYDAKVKELVRDKRRDVATLAYTLAYMDRTGLYTWLGFEDLPSYALARGAVVSKETARAYVQLVERLERLPLMTAAFIAGEVDYSKLREVSRAATPANEAELLELAKTKSYRTCWRAAAIARGLDPRESRPFRLTTEQHGWVDEALRVAKARAGRPLSDAEALATICRDWLQERGTIVDVASSAASAPAPDRSAGPTETTVTPADAGAVGKADVVDAAAGRPDVVGTEPPIAPPDPLEVDAPFAPDPLRVDAPFATLAGTPATEGGEAGRASASAELLVVEPVVARPASSSSLLEALRRLTAG